jgi:outer membrane receptor for ferrienterochelin and colicin
MVRVPLHAISSKINYQINKDLNSSLLLTYKGQTRDYGGQDYSFKDQILDEYLLLDLASSYKLSEGYKLNFSLKNVFDKKYENALDYSGIPRTINIALNKSF